MGEARLHTHQPVGGAVGMLVLGHGAGGGVDAPDLVAVTAAALAARWRVVTVEQPYRVLPGRRPPPRAPRLDAAWAAVLHAVVEPGVPVVVGGRSSGARVACRGASAAAPDVDGVVALAFPLLPPAGRPDRSAELLAVTAPLLVVQGERDSFGGPSALTALGVTVHAVAGADHAFSPRVRDGRTRAECCAEVGLAVAGFLRSLTD